MADDLYQAALDAIRRLADSSDSTIAVEKLQQLSVEIDELIDEMMVEDEGE